jgi:TPR repeat protein
MRLPDASVGSLDPTLGMLYREGREHYRAGRYIEALESYERLAGLAPADARVAHFVGILYWWAPGTRRNPEKAYQWLERAARAGDRYAFLSLSKICRESGRPDEARQWLQEVADAGYPPALFFLGHGWEFGYWGTVDRSRALEYYERAASKGYCRADWRIGALLARGERGFWQIPVGLFKYVRAPLKMSVLLWRDPYDERVIW